MSSTVKKGQSKIEEPEVAAPVLDITETDLSNSETRWVIPPETTLRLYAKFFSKRPGTFESTLTFENNFNLKRLPVAVVGKTEFPSISNQPKQLFNNVKKARPTTIPECYLARNFVLSENTFDFGPLLIGKNAEKKTDKDIVVTNSSVVKLLNNGSYPANIECSFLSSVIEGDPAFKKNIFTVSMESTSIEEN